MIVSSKGMPDLQKDNVWYLLVVLSLPTTVATSVNALFNFVDRYFLAHLGETEFTAVSMAFVVQMSVSAVALGVGSGFTVLIGRAVGDNDTQSRTNYLILSGCAILLLSLITALIGIWWVDDVSSLMGVSAVMHDDFTTYLSIVLLGGIGIYMPIILNSVVRAEGDMIKPMKVMLMGALLNVVLDPILIFGVASIPAMGIEGAAYATVIARFLSCVYAVKLYFSHFRCGLKSTRNGRRKGVFWLRPCSSRVVRFSLPSILMNIFPPVIFSLLFVLLEPFDDSAKAGFSLAISCGLIVLFPVVGISRSLLTLVSQNLVANRLNRCREIVISATRLSLFITLGLSLCVMLMSEILVGFFLSSHYRMGQFFLYCYCLSLPFQVLIQIRESCLQGAGYFGLALLVRLSMASVILAAALLNQFYDEAGVAMGIVVGSVVQAWISGFFIRRIPR